jgi:cyclase
MSERSEPLGRGKVEDLGGGLYAYVQPDGTWFINNTGFLVGRDGVVSIDTTSTERRTRAYLDAIGRVSDRPVRTLVNTHHHGDHTSGNPVFRGVARRVVAHGMADQHMRRGPVAPQQASWQQPQQSAKPQQPPQDAPAPLYPDTTFSHSWSAEVGDERIVARHHGRGHTSGDAVITFERANVVHMGDLMFNQRHPVVDRAAGASIRNWTRLLDQVVNAHTRDTIYIFGHANTGLPVTGSSADLLKFRDYLGALTAFVERHVTAGRSREEVLAMRQPLAGFEAWGPFGQANVRDPLTVAYEEVTTGS